MIPQCIKSGTSVPEDILALKVLIAAFSDFAKSNKRKEDKGRKVIKHRSSDSNYYPEIHELFSEGGRCLRDDIIEAGKRHVKKQKSLRDNSGMPASFTVDRNVLFSQHKKLSTPPTLCSNSESEDTTPKKKKKRKNQPERSSDDNQDIKVHFKKQRKSEKPNKEEDLGREEELKRDQEKLKRGQDKLKRNQEKLKRNQEKLKKDQEELRRYREKPNQADSRNADQSRHRKRKSVDLSAETPDDGSCKTKKHKKEKEKFDDRKPRERRQMSEVSPKDRHNDLKTRPRKHREGEEKPGDRRDEERKPRITRKRTNEDLEEYPSKNCNSSRDKKPRKGQDDTGDVTKDDHDTREKKRQKNGDGKGSSNPQPGRKESKVSETKQIRRQLREPVVCNEHHEKRKILEVKRRDDPEKREVGFLETLKNKLRDLKLRRNQ
ncbi:hypothetical protein BZA77DRAFT_354186 [Pyronema omphalodes]|nr:hypothetical protein BZA77DRAFT_354186 [Pyronema omphalodes]